MSTTVHAMAAKSARGKLETFEFTLPDIGPEQVEIKVESCGICHSDLSMLDNDWGFSAYPFVPGHEVVGTVAAVGERVKHVKVGQRVGLGWFSGARKRSQKKGHEPEKGSLLNTKFSIITFSPG